MGKPQNNAQGEMQLVAEWLATLPPTWRSKTHVNVGAQTLVYAGNPLTPAQSRSFGVWNDWADARVYTGTEVWIVEGKLVATGSAYGQVLDYVNQYPTSEDAKLFPGAPVIPMVLTMASRARTASLFVGLGVQTIVYAPSFPLSQALAKLFPAAQILGGTGGA
jgi:hypothetical protein